MSQFPKVRSPFWQSIEQKKDLRWILKKLKSILGWKKNSADVFFVWRGSKKLFSGSSSTIPVSLLLNGSKSGEDRGWYDIDSDQIYYYTTSPSQQGKIATF